MRRNHVIKVFRRAALGCILVLVGGCTPGLANVPAANTGSPAVVVEELLAADRAFGAASMNTDMVTGLSAMFDSTITMPIPGNAFARGREAAVRALASNPDNARSRIEWAASRVTGCTASPTAT